MGIPMLTSEYTLDENLRITNSHYGVQKLIPMNAAVSYTCTNPACRKEEEYMKMCMCRMAYYCSKDCQGLDWKSHRSYCTEIEKNRMLGSANVFEFDYTQKIGSCFSTSVKPILEDFVNKLPPSKNGRIPNLRFYSRLIRLDNGKRVSIMIPPPYFKGAPESYLLLSRHFSHNCSYIYLTAYSPWYKTACTVKFRHDVMVGAFWIPYAFSVIKHYARGGVHDELIRDNCNFTCPMALSYLYDNALKELGCDESDLEKRSCRPVYQPFEPVYKRM